MRSADGGARADVTGRLHATVGNASLARAFSAAGATRRLLRYEAGEHAQFGAKAGEKETTTKVSGVEMTYGEMIAMGDLFATPDDMRKAKKDELEALLKLIRRERDQGIGSVKEEDWIKAAGDRYLDLAAKNDPHFGSPSGAKGFDSGPGNRQEWWTHHQRALRLAQAGKLDEALQVNAFGDHFLTDAFAAGHLFNKAEVLAKARENLKDPQKFERAVAKGILADSRAAAKLKDYQANPGAFSPWTDVTVNSLADVIDRIRFWKGDKFYSTFVKAVHDRLNQAIKKGEVEGVEVENAKGQKWNLSGDKTLALSGKTLEIGREAVARSRQNVLDAKDAKKLDPLKMAQTVWDYVPKPTEAGAKQVQGAITELTDPDQQAAVDAWAKITLDNFEEVFQELLKNGLLREKPKEPEKPAKKRSEGLEPLPIGPKW